MDQHYLNLGGKLVGCTESEVSELLLKISKMGNLNSLTLDDNQLFKIDFPKNGFNSIEHLSISRNFLTELTIPENFLALNELSVEVNKLQKLELSEKLDKIVNITAHLNKLQHFNVSPSWKMLKTLNFGNNELTSLSLPPGIDSLDALDLSNNNLSEFILSPNWVHLRKIYIDGNKLTRLEIPDSVNLSVLLFHNNPLVSFIFNSENTNLVSLTLADLGKLDLNFLLRFSNLKRLSLSGPNIRDLSVLDKLPALSSLSISRTNLSSINLKGKSPRINDLYISDNKSLKEIEIGPGIKSIENLNLPGNALTSLKWHPDLVVTNINLFKNNFTKFPKEILTLQGLKRLSIGNNPISDFPKELLELSNCLGEAKQHFNSSGKAYLDIFSILEAKLKDTHPENEILSLRFDNLSKLTREEQARIVELIAKKSTLCKRVMINIEDPDLTYLDLANIKNITKLYIWTHNLRDFNFPSDVSKLVELYILSAKLQSMKIGDEFKQLSDLSFFLPEVTGLSISDSLKLDFLGVRSLLKTNFTISKHWTSLTSLEVSQGYNGDLINIPKELVNIQRVQIKNTQVKKIIIPETINNLAALNIENNNLLTKIVLSDTQNTLWRFDVNSNEKLTEIPIPKDMKKLVEFNVYSNPVMQAILIPKNPERIHSIKIGGKNITKIQFPENLNGLTSLSISNTGLKKISLPPKLPSLTHFDIENNLVNSISFPEMPEIININISKNKLTSFPVEILKYNTLREINISGNAFTDLPKNYNNANTSVDVLRNHYKIKSEHP